MPLLNRFPLLGLWAKEAARRLGFRKDEAAALGHAYAVLYAIRAQGTRKKTAKKPEERRLPRRVKTEQMEFSGDHLPIQHDKAGHIQGLVGHEKPQTAQTYRANIIRKFPAGYYETLEEAFRAVMKAIAPRELRSPHRVYQLYDEWKRSCGAGRMVDLDKLLDWCEEHSTKES